VICPQPIGPVIVHYGGDKPRDRKSWQKILCPFHNDSTASATINTELNAFNCFACGVKGDTYSIIMQQEGVEFREAVKIAEGITGHSSPSVRDKNRLSRGVSSAQGAISGRRSESRLGSGRRATSRA